MERDEYRNTIPASSNLTLGSDDAGTSVEPVQGLLIGRYMVISQLGAGAMGVVFAAFDPELNRKVALKLLKHHGGEHANARLQREAQSLAKLVHPNVVSVFDVGLHHAHLFVAMEFVEGQTLGKWMSATESPRPWREILAVFMDAGRGLAAAHEVGLIHRDFKPDNVMVGEDGRVRVMDFGLAREDGEGSDAGALADLRGPVAKLTQTGAMLGTPAYMSLEQFEAGEVDARTDQFGFCVALYEALYGERPFAGETIADLLRSLQREEIRPAPQGANVPSWLREVVIRGLARDTAARWPSMHALLDALADDPGPRRRRRIVVGATVATLLVGALGGGWWIDQALQADARYCERVTDELAGAWDEDQRRAVERAILGTELSYAESTWERIEAHLDAYASAWTSARLETCEATLHQEQSSELLDLRIACLDERRTHLRVTVDELARADAQVVEQAVAAVLALPSVERCSDLDALMAEVPPPDEPAVAERAAALAEELVAVKAMEELAKYDEALTRADAIVTEAAELGYEPLMARAWLQQASLQQATGKHEDSMATLKQALDAALAQRMMSEAADASLLLTQVVSVDLARQQDGRRWVELAGSLTRSVGTDEMRARWLMTLGSLARVEGAYEDAVEHTERARAIYQDSLGPEHIVVANSLGRLGALAHDRGRYDEARDYFGRAHAIYDKALGGDHPTTAQNLMNLGNVARTEGKYEEARGYLETALELLERALGPEHIVVAKCLGMLGITHYEENGIDEARSLWLRGLDIEERVLGREHPSVGMTLMNLGNAAYSEKNYELAREYYGRSLVIKKKTLGEDHPSLGFSYTNLGLVALDEGSYTDAREYLELAVALWEKSLGPEHPNLMYPLSALGDTLMKLGQPEAALPHSERAVTIAIAGKRPPMHLAQLRFDLAQALWEAPASAGRDRRRARELVELVRSTYAEQSDAAEELAAAEAWLAEHTD